MTRSGRPRSFDKSTALKAARLRTSGYGACWQAFVKRLSIDLFIDIKIKNVSQENSALSDMLKAQSGFETDSFCIAQRLEYDLLPQLV